MTQTILTAGDATNSGVTTQGGNDGTLTLVVGPNGAKVNALAIAADGTPTFIIGSLYATGDMIDTFAVTARSGFVMASGRTIGNAVSIATERANADTSALFMLLWSSMSNTEAPVLPSGRGASALADFTANKTIGLPDLRGRVAVGKDNMGGTAANRMTAGGSGVAGTTLGTSGGGETLVLITANLPAHNHPINDPAHAHGMNGAIEDDGGAVYNVGSGGRGSAVYSTSAAVTGITVGNTGSATPINNLQPVYVVNKIIKL
jgi:microcystin-dependent protein